jgi:hypothetical protein
VGHAIFRIELSSGSLTLNLGGLVTVEVVCRPGFIKVSARSHPSGKGLFVPRRGVGTASSRCLLARFTYYSVFLFKHAHN